MLSADYIVVGSGLTGTVIARLLADAGRDVAIVERRAHFGGNVYDRVHRSGIRMHEYGPHYFRTDSERVWSFVSRFASFYRYEARVLTLVDGHYQNWPISGTYLRQVAGADWRASFHATPRNFEEACQSLMPAIVYEKLVKSYTEKQWGVPASRLDAGLAKRFDVRMDDDPRLSRCKYQGLPVDGYSGMFTRMLAGIPVLLGTDYLKQIADIHHRKLLVFTGPIDEFFGLKYGRLKYRAQERVHAYFPRVEWVLPCAQVNNPDPIKGGHIRSIEWKHLMTKDNAAKVHGTVITRETPYTPLDADHYEYPFPDDENRCIYKHYRAEADRQQRLLICGRLGDYRYYDMDHAIWNATCIVRRILAGGA